MPESTRLMVIESAISVERNVAEILSILLDIDYQTSKTMGNTSSSFSFKQKLDLLTDISALDRKAVPKFQAYAEIRNQFAHNYDVKDFTTCFKYLESTEKFLRNNYKEYSSTDAEREFQLALLYTALYVDIQKYITDLAGKVEEKGYNIGWKEGRIEATESLIQYIYNYSNQDPSFKEMMKVVVAGWLEEREKSRVDK